MALAVEGVVEKNELERAVGWVGLFRELLDDAEGGDDFFAKDGVHWEIMNATE